MIAVNENQPNPFLIVFGKDNAGKPHASWFDQPSAALATKAAALMNMRAVPVESSGLRELAGSLPRGRVFSSGRAFTPFVKGKLYSQLVELTRDMLRLTVVEGDGPGQAAMDGATGGSSASDQAAGPGGALPSGTAPQLPRTPDEIGIGSQVLAHESPDDGWWEAVVIGMNGSSLTLTWRDFAGQPSFVRRQTEVALLPARG